MSGYAERVAGRLPEVREAVEVAARKSGRTAEDVRIVAVTKGHPLEAAEAAVGAGLLDLGENRVGELEEKVARWNGPDVRWHMVGHVQRRKVPRLLPAVHLLHSVDSARLARRIQSVAESEELDRVPVLLQVNTSGEAAKYGFSPEGLREALDGILALSRLEVRGLMTMAPLTDDEVVLRRTFSSLRELHREVGERHDYEGDQLSMGMTNDYRVAVEEGSTMIRIGTELFGERPG